jgi:deferrochelatase/peroxidase EfeB
MAHSSVAVQWRKEEEEVQKQKQEDEDEREAFRRHVPWGLQDPTEAGLPAVGLALLCTNPAAALATAL